MVNLTQSQAKAIHTHDKNLIVVAGAGSGKTFVLVERYLALLNTHDWPLNALVAVTFTEKAAQEMRDRVRQALERLFAATDDPPTKQKWAKHLAEMDSARINTIHSLCATILRANAAEAGVDPRFEVLDEVDARILLENAIDDALELIDDDDPILELFTEYDLPAIRQTLTSGILTNSLSPIPDDIEQQWITQWERVAADTLAGLWENEDFQRAINWTPPQPVVDEDDKLFICWRDAMAFLDVIQFNKDIAARVDALKSLSSTSVIKLNGGSVKNWGSKAILQDSKDALRTIREMSGAAVKVIGDPPGEVDSRAAFLLPLWVDLIHRVRARYADLKREKSLLDFDDLENRTRDLLTAHEHVRRRYRGVEFKHLLVDEFQDTNRAQWEIIQALADINQGGTLFVVGDPKQSIYGFRGADVSVFGAVRRQIEDRGGERVPLAQSFRTHKMLVDGFNAIFENILVRNPTSPVKDFEVIYEEPMTAFRPDAPGEVAIDCILLSKQAADLDKLSAEDARRWEAYEIAQRLQRMVADSVPVYDKEQRVFRPVQYDDMALLFQSTTHITLYEDVFKTVGLRYITIAGRGYFSRQEVWDLLNLLRALHNPADNLSVAAALRSPLFSLSDDALLALRLQTDEAGNRLLLWNALSLFESVPFEDRQRLAFTREVLDYLRLLAGRVTISELLREILSLTGYLATLTGLPDGDRRRENVEKLVTLAQASGRTTLGAFSLYLEDLSAREVREGEAVLEADGAVTLMTVHASKGLEYPVVVLVDTSWRRGSGRGDSAMVGDDSLLACKVYDPANDEMVNTFSYKRALELQALREEAERKRLLYVAATRAQDYLIVSGNRTAKTYTGSWLNLLLDALGVDDDAPDAHEFVIPCSWGSARVIYPDSLPPEDVLSGDLQTVTMWDDRTILARSQQSEVDFPPLLHDVPIERAAPARHLSATHLADLGGFQHAVREQDRLFYRDRFQRRVLYDAPSHIPAIRSQNQTRWVSQRQLGDIVHAALRYWRFPDDTDDMHKLLESYAWELGITEKRALKDAVGRAMGLLYQFKQHSDVYHWITEARNAGRDIYPELPFIFRTDNRIIHGIIDVLFRREDTWVILDYKTSFVHNDDRIIDPVRTHAQRYYVQVGMYAAAAREQLRAFGYEVTPLVYIHYLSHNQTIDVPTASWEAELKTIEDRIGSLIMDE